MICQNGNFFFGTVVDDIIISNPTIGKSLFIGAAQFIISNAAATLNVATTLTSVGTDNTATSYLCRSTVNVIVRRAIESGTIESTWTTQSGFTAFSDVISYSRVGCSFVFDAATTAAGTNVTRVTLPIARYTNFSAIQQAKGTIVVSPNPDNITVSGGYVKAVTGTTNEVELVLLNASGAGAVTLIGTFQYPIG